MSDEIQEVQVSFSLGEVNQILERLGDLPAKQVFDLIGFLRNRAQEAVNAAAQPAETPKD